MPVCGGSLWHQLRPWCNSPCLMAHSSTYSLSQFMALTAFGALAGALTRSCTRRRASSLRTSPTGAAWPAPSCGCTTSSRPSTPRARPTRRAPGRRCDFFSKSTSSTKCPKLQGPRSRVASWSVRVESVLSCLSHASGFCRAITQRKLLLQGRCSLGAGSLVIAILLSLRIT